MLNTRGRSLFPITLAAAITPLACTSTPDPAPVPTPSVHELASLQSRGQLDPNRLHCAIGEAGTLAEDVRADSRLVRELDRRRGSAAGQTHARVVQEGMAASDEANLAARAAQDARRAALQATRDGDHTRAAVFGEYAARLLEPARGPSPIGRDSWWAVSRRGADLDDGEAELFVEYASLRTAAVGTGASDAVTDRILSIESTSPQVVEVYAGLLLGLYESPELVCTEFDPK